MQIFLVQDATIFDKTCRIIGVKPSLPGNSKNNLFQGNLVIRGGGDGRKLVQIWLGGTSALGFGGEMCWAHYLFLKQILQPTLTPSGLRLSSPSQPAESCLVCSGPGWGCPGTACALRGALRARLLNHFSLHPSPFHSLSCADGAILVMLCQCLLLGPNLAISGHFGSVFAFLGTIMAIRGHFVRVFFAILGAKNWSAFFWPFEFILGQIWHILTVWVNFSKLTHFGPIS